MKHIRKNNFSIENLLQITITLPNVPIIFSNLQLFNLLKSSPMKKFHIIKKSYIWIVSALALIGASLVLFLLNAKFSEEFTGGVNISLRTTADPQDIQEKLTNYLSDQGYANTNVHINQTTEEVQIKINASLENDEKVAELSTDVKNFLTSENLVSSSQDII
jgi:preprotein translocase subunit SecF